MALTRICPFCLMPQAECVCDDETEQPAGGRREPVADVDVLIAAVRESVTVVRPGDVLAVRLPMSMSPREVHMARDYAKAIEEESGLKVVFIPGEEFEHATVNVTVNGFTAAGKDLAAMISEAVRQETLRYASRMGGNGPVIGP